MEVSLFEKLFAKERLSRYRTAASNDPAKTEAIYKHNLRISMAFYPILSSFEVASRNLINHELSNFFGDPDWIINQHGGSGFMSRGFHYNAIKKSKRKLQRAQKPITAGRLIAEQSLGFWVEFFERAPYRAVSGRPIHVFAQKLATANRATIRGKLHKIRLFRNRVYHNAPIIFNSNTLDWSIPEESRDSIQLLCYWMEPQFNTWLSPYYTNLSTCIDQAKQF